MRYAVAILLGLVAIAALVMVITYAVVFAAVVLVSARLARKPSHRIAREPRKRGPRY